MLTFFFMHILFQIATSDQVFYFIFQLNSFFSCVHGRSEINNSCSCSTKWVVHTWARASTKIFPSLSSSEFYLEGETEGCSCQTCKSSSSASDFVIETGRCYHYGGENCLFGSFSSLAPASLQLWQRLRACSSTSAYS